MYQRAPEFAGTRGLLDADPAMAMWTTSGAASTVAEALAGASVFGAVVGGLSAGSTRGAATGALLAGGLSGATFGGSLLVLSRVNQNPSLVAPGVVALVAGLVALVAGGKRSRDAMRGKRS